MKYILKKFITAMTAITLAGAMVAGSVAFSVSETITASAATTSTLSTTSSTSDEWPEAPEITSGSAILIDADTGAILYDKNSHEISYPASTTKILTGLLAIENCSLTDIVTFSKEAANSVTWEDAQLGAIAGEQMTVEQVLYGMLLHSANEFAYALGEQVAGSITAFADMMNQRAKELGALNTHFANASGLHDLNHYTTAYDMAMIAKGCYNNATFVNIDSTATSYTIPATNKYAARTFKHRHEMLKGRTYEYEYCKGGKTGFTDEAGYTLVTFAEKDDMRLICVVFKSESDKRYIDTRTLFDWGFANFKNVTSSNGSISSLLSSDSFYDSKVFNSYNLDLNLTSSTLTLPKNMSVGDVDIDIDDNYETTNNNGVYTAKLNFTAQDNIVGTATLRISTPANLAASSNAPLLITSASSSGSPKRCIVINLWALIAVVILLFILANLISAIKAANKRRRRRRGRKLRM
jgi:D-alanyl-D-alanine carboxypeptidase